MRCSVCRRKLTDPASIALGIGPECRDGRAGGRRARLMAVRQARGLSFRACQPFSVGGLSFSPAGDGADWQVGQSVMPAAQVETYLRCYDLADLSDTPLTRTITALRFSHPALAAAAATLAAGASLEAVSLIWLAAGNVAEGGVRRQPARAYDMRGLVREANGNWELMVMRRGRVLCRVTAFSRPAVWHPGHLVVDVPAVGLLMCRHELAWRLAEATDMMVEGVEHG